MSEFKIFLKEVKEHAKSNKINIVEATIDIAETMENKKFFISTLLENSNKFLTNLSTVKMTEEQERFILENLYDPEFNYADEDKYLIKIYKLNIFKSISEEEVFNHFSNLNCFDCWKYSEFLLNTLLKKPSLITTDNQLNEFIKNQFYSRGWELNAEPSCVKPFYIKLYKLLQTINIDYSEIVKPFRSFSQFIERTELEKQLVNF